MAGRFAPTPTSDLHLGNLRTALLAWMMARRSGRLFHLRIEDLDQQRVAAAQDVGARQIADLTALGMDWDGPIMVQSGRLDAYTAALATLAGHTYECYCTRKEIAESAQAPHADGYRPYPGTCRDLAADERAARRAVRPPALRIRADGATQVVHDVWAGDVAGVVDDFVLVRNDGVPSYNLAVVVDDMAQGVDQVVRGDDLLSSAPRQAWLTRLLGGQIPEYGHVPLAVNARGVRLAKRDGAVTLADLASLGQDSRSVLARIGASLTLCSPDELVDAHTLLARFDPATMPRRPWVID